MIGHRHISMGLMASILGMTAAGCGQVPATPLAQPVPVQTLSQGAGMSASELASRFAASFSGDTEFRAVRQGSLVTLTGPEDIRLVYDFTRTPDTGKVRIQTGDAVVETPYPADARGVAWTVTKIAIRMVYGGVKAYLKYMDTHPGNVDKKELAEWILYGMLKYGVGGLPGGFLWKRLFPIVWRWVVGDPPPVRKLTAKQLYQRWSKDLPEIEAILREYFRQQSQGALPQS